MMSRTPSPLLSEIPIGFIPRTARAHIRRDVRNDPAAMLEIYRLWPSFMLGIDALASADADPLIEDFAPVYALYRMLLRRGVMFGAAFIEMMESINASCAESPDDGDSDHFDAYLNLEDSDEDVGCLDGFGGPTKETRPCGPLMNLPKGGVQ